MSTTPKRLTAAQIREIRRLLTVERKTRGEIAELFNLNIHMVTKILAGVRRLDSGEEKLRELFQQGLSDEQIAERTGMAISSVNRYLSRYCLVNTKKRNLTRGQRKPPRESRPFKILIAVLKDIGNDAEVARVHGCTREYVGQIRAFARANHLAIIQPARTREEWERKIKKMYQRGLTPRGKPPVISLESLSPDG
ncbi:MAG: hypothetical protein SFV32_12685 [Opitutaceae bacterium]|nr:hypothetical protein [Opitutaceae bacterium]